ncbi:MAG: hypothetical protein H6512_07580 [Acidimicrobiia bacterium]|nr:hypothetical protein [Acidimicrobiia bacterium]
MAWVTVSICIAWSVQASGWVGGASTPGVDDLALNQAQMVGTHNSYHVATTPSPTRADTKAPLAEQFDFQGVRHIELDVYDWAGQWRVLHTPITDQGSTCPTLAACLSQVAGWSHAHPDHDPIVIFIDPKYDEIFNRLLPMNDDDVSRLDHVVADALGRERIMTPPSCAPVTPLCSSGSMDRVGLASASFGGRFLVVVNDDSFVQRSVLGHQRDGVLLASSQDPSRWGGDVVFAEVEQPGEQERIAAALNAHMMVRTFADTDLVEVRAGDGRRAERAFASGAQLIVTDQPADSRADRPNSLPGGYGVVTSSGQPIACNPVVADPQRCSR